MSEKDEKHNRFYGITECQLFGRITAMDGFVTDFCMCLLHNRMALLFLSLLLFLSGCWLELFPAELIIKSYEVL